MSKIFDEDVGSFNQFQECLDVVVLFEIQRYAFFATVNAGKLSAETGCQKRSEMTGIVSNFGPFDFYHFRTQIGEDLGGEGPCPHHTEVQHPDSLKRQFSHV